MVFQLCPKSFIMSSRMPNGVEFWAPVKDDDRRKEKAPVGCAGKIAVVMTPRCYQGYLTPLAKA